MVPPLSATIFVPFVISPPFPAASSPVLTHREMFVVGEVKIVLRLAQRFGGLCFRLDERVAFYAQRCIKDFVRRVELSQGIAGSPQSPFASLLRARGVGQLFFRCFVKFGAHTCTPAICLLSLGPYKSRNSARRCMARLRRSMERFSRESSADNSALGGLILSTTFPATSVTGR